MSKQIIPFINVICENTKHVIPLAQKYVESGADGLYVFCYAKSDIEKDEFLSLLNKLTKTVDIPVIAGFYITKTEEVMKAFSAGVSKVVIQNKFLPNDYLYPEIVAKYGPDKVYLEMDQKVFMEGDFTEGQFILKHLTLSDDFVEKVNGLNGTVLFRDSLKKNAMKDLLSLNTVHGVSTDGLKDRDISLLKGELYSDGIDVTVFKAAMSFDEFKLNSDGMVPVIVQDNDNDQVLMLAYMDKEAYEMTMKTGRMHYHSRSRNELWCKGDTSGHYQYVRKLYIDCDNDTILAKVIQIGAACHTGNRTCFYRDLT